MDTIGPDLKGIIRCARYSFMPNRLHLCGPENQADILEFYSATNEKKPTRSIRPLLEQFETLFPYLKLIAKANNCKNPFAEKIVEAYWLGNKCLEKVPAGRLFDHVRYDIQLKRRVGVEGYRQFVEQFDAKALPHHNFHVFSIYRRTGNIKIPHTLATIDACRISWGKVIKTEPHSLIVRTKPLVADKNGAIKESESFTERAILNYFEGSVLRNNIRLGDYVSLHWGCVCEKLRKEQVNNLQKYTELSLRYANTI
jgi:hypothetical protein